MHISNKLYWSTVCDRFPELFCNRRVLEVGSFNVNGSVRRYFSDCDYTGLDWRRGDLVDVVCLAHDMPFDSSSFDTVISASMLEHDPHWDKSLRKMVDVLTDDGSLLLSWGSAINKIHRENTCPDYHHRDNPAAFHPRPVVDVLNLLEEVGMHIQEFRYEFNVWKENNMSHKRMSKPMGYAASIFFKNRSHVRESEKVIDELHPKDMERTVQDIDEGSTETS